MTGVVRNTTQRKRTAQYKFTGNPCKRGHTGPRYSNGNCVECLLAREAERYADPAFASAKKLVESKRHYANPVKSAERSRVYRLSNRDSISSTNRKRYAEDPSRRAAIYRWRKESPARFKEIARRYHLKNSTQRYERSLPWRARNRGRLNTYGRRHYAANKVVYTEKRARRRLLESRSIPPWADRLKILQLYRQARDETLRTGVQMSVDHRVPLKGRVGGSHIVCGLHTEQNLAVIPLIDNKTKSNTNWELQP